MTFDAANCWISSHREKMFEPLSEFYRPFKLSMGHDMWPFRKVLAVGASLLEHAPLCPLAASPRNDTGAAVPLRGVFVELVAGVHLGHQSIVFYRATPSVLYFCLSIHVFLLSLQTMAVPWQASMGIYIGR
jgi:hypothetical protein